MASRMDKYQSNNESRTSRNRKLYDDIYSDTSYSNSVILDDTKEIDIEKIKELINKEKKLEDKKVMKPTIDLSEFEELKTTSEEKIYDINEVLKDAKSKRNILEEANEKKKMYSDSYKAHLDIDEELAKSKNVYDKLVQEETELLDIMNTLTGVTVNEDKDAYKDLTTEANKYNTGTINTKQIKPIEETNIEESKTNTKTAEYNTNTFMFDKRDFVSNEEVESSLRKTSIFIKILLFLVVVSLILIGYYIVKKYVLK